MSHKRKTAAGYFPLNPGCFIGILTRVYYSRHITHVFSLLKWETMESKESLIFAIHPLVPSFSGIFYHLPATEKRKKTTRLQQWLILYHWNGPKFFSMRQWCTSSSFHQVISSFLMDRWKGNDFSTILRPRPKTPSPHISLHSKVQGKYRKPMRFLGSKVS